MVVEFASFAEFVRAVGSGRVLPGDTVYVARPLYEALSADERGWLWRQALALRAQLVTDLDVDPPVVVHRRAADVRGARATDAPDVSR